MEGTVAFLKPYPDDDCVYVVAAEGESPEQVTCLGGRQGGGELVWLPDGQLQVTHYGDAQHPNDRWRKLVDVRTGAVENAPEEEIPARSGSATESPGPHGEKVVSRTSRGRLTVTLTTDRGRRTLLSVGAPDTYTFGRPEWSPDGSWFVAKDDLDRLLVVTTADPSQTRVLVDGGWGQAVTDADLLGTGGADRIDGPGDEQTLGSG